MKTHKCKLNFGEHRLIFEGAGSPESSVTPDDIPEGMVAGSEPPPPMTQEEADKIATKNAQNQASLMNAEGQDREKESEKVEKLSKQFEEGSTTGPELTGSEPEDPNDDPKDPKEKSEEKLKAQEEAKKANEDKKEKEEEKKSIPDQIKQAIIDMVKRFNEFFDNLMKNISEGFGQVKEMVDKQTPESKDLVKREIDLNSDIKAIEDTLKKLPADSEDKEGLEKKLKKLKEEREKVKAELAKIKEGWDIEDTKKKEEFKTKLEKKIGETNTFQGGEVLISEDESVIEVRYNQGDANKDKLEEYIKKYRIEPKIEDREIEGEDKTVISFNLSKSNMDKLLETLNDK